MRKDVPKVKNELPVLEDDFFEAFDESTYEKWREAAEKSLKGAPFEKKLLSKTYAGITLQPIYDREDAEVLPHMESLPGFAPFTRGAKLLGHLKSSWLVSQEYPQADPGALNSALSADVGRGLGGINIPLHPSSKRGEDTPGNSEFHAKGMCLTLKGDLDKALAGIDTSTMPLYVQAGIGGLPVFAMLASGQSSDKTDAASLSGCVGSDPLEVLAHDGSLPVTLDSLFDQMAAMTVWAAQNAPLLKTLPVHTHLYHDAGASVVEELAFGLATGVEYVRAMVARNVSIDDAASRVRLNVSVGCDFFMEVAKLRAARLVWSLAMNAMGASEESQKLEIHARTGFRSQTLHDPYVNMLRATTECFSALVGGTDSLHASPFDEVVGSSDEFSRRIARNLHSVLRDESHLGQIIDPAGGSWFVEQLTDSVARKAWELFQNIEEQGGMCQALVKGQPQNTVAQVRKERESDLGSRKAVVVGTNRYANLNEDALEITTEIDSDFVKTREALTSDRDEKAIKKALKAFGKSDATNLVDLAIAAVEVGATVNELLTNAPGAKKGDKITVERVVPVRTSEIYEGLRAAAKHYQKEHGHAPKVFLANMGPLAQHKARADFSRDFFAVGGFEVLTNNGFDTPEAAALAALESKAQISVICSTDDTYPTLVPAYLAALKNKQPDGIAVLAGYPKDQIEEHKKSGVDEFIHLRANNYDLLTSFFQRIGAVK